MSDGKYEIGCHNCQHLQTETGSGTKPGTGCELHPRIVWPDTDEVLLCLDFECRFELRTQPGYEDLDKVFGRHFRSKMKPGKIFSYIPHGNVPHLTAYPMKPPTVPPPSPDNK